jgi:acyl-coenzyme A thioesterase 9
MVALRWLSWEEVRLTTIEADHTLPRHRFGKDPLRCDFLPSLSDERDFLFHPTMRPTAKTALRQIRLTSQCRYPIIQVPLLSLKSSRSFHCSQAQRTDGVFKELTSMRVRTPWVEALRQQQSEGKQSAEPSGKPEVSKDRELKAKHMDDSYHSVVLPLAQDPWLLDTYLNSSGHIRLGTIFMDLDALSGIIACKPR